VLENAETTCQIIISISQVRNTSPEVGQLTSQSLHAACEPEYMLPRESRTNDRHIRIETQSTGEVLCVDAHKESRKAPESLCDSKTSAFLKITGVNLQSYQSLMGI